MMMDHSYQPMMTSPIVFEFVSLFCYPKWRWWPASAFGAHDHSWHDADDGYDATLAALNCSEPSIEMGEGGTNQ